MSVLLRVTRARCWGFSVLPILCMLLVNSLRGSERGSIWGFALTVCVALLFLLFPSFPGLFDVSLCVVWLCAAEGNLQVITGN